jgi:site-specific recombinase XerC
VEREAKSVERFVWMRQSGIRYIQELLGHASVATTQIYTKVVIKDLKKVYQNTHPRARR